jgi:hypothetical protein
MPNWAVAIVIAISGTWYARLWWRSNIARHKKRARDNERIWLDELVQEHVAGTRDNRDKIRWLISAIEKDYGRSPPDFRDSLNCAKTALQLGSIEENIEGLKIALRDHQF